MRTSVVLAAVVLALVACSPYERWGLKAGASVEADVRKSMGEPGLVLANADGTRQLAYPTGPLGTQTHMVYLRTDGVVDRIEPVLTDSQVGRIVNRQTTRAEVERLLGPPWRVQRFENLGQDAWDYHYRDAWGYLVDLAVMIDDRGIVVGRVHARRESGRDSLTTGR